MGKSIGTARVETLAVVSTARVGRRVFLARVNDPARLVSKWTGVTSDERMLGPVADGSKDSKG